jgi:hypothetical protein
MPNRKKSEGHAPKSGDDRFRSLENAAPAGRDETSSGLESPALACRVNTCEIGDHGQKWSGVPNYDCPRCGYATIDRDTAVARNPAAFR